MDIDFKRKNQVSGRNFTRSDTGFVGRGNDRPKSGDNRPESVQSSSQSVNLGRVNAFLKAVLTLRKLRETPQR